MEMTIAVASIVVLLVLLLLTVWKFGKFLKKGTQAIFGNDAAAAVLGFGLAVICVPEMLKGPYNALTRAVAYLFEALPPQVSLILDRTQPADFRNNTWRIIGSILANTIRTTQFSIIDVAIGFALWVLATRLLEGLFTGSESGVGRRIRAYLGRMSEMSKNNAALVTIVLLGCYLSIASIAAVPWFQQTTLPTEIDANHLNEALKSAGIPTEVFNESYPLDLPSSDPFQRLRSLLNLSATPVEPGKEQKGASSTDKPISPQVSPSPRAYIRPTESNKEGMNPLSPESKLADAPEVERRATQALYSMEQDRKVIRSKWVSLRQNALNRQQELQRDLSEEFSVQNVGRVGTQEKAKYFADLLTFYRTDIQYTKSQLTGCRNFIQLMESGWASSAIGIENIVREARATPRADLLSRLYESQPDYAVGASPVCEIHDVVGRPSPSDPGQDWGIFAFFARWLMRTQSLALAVICGMVGVGLLGSGVSSFLQKRVTPKAGEPEGHDLLSIVVRGFSAAIVVYLAVRGGMAAVGSPSNDPNPYVLLFMCLIGTVYSDDVWQWAKEKFKSSLAGKTGDQNAATAGDGVGKVIKQEPPPEAPEHQPEENGQKDTGVKTD